MASFYQFAEVCQALSQTQSWLQMAKLAGEFLASLDIEEAEAAARFRSDGPCRSAMRASSTSVGARWWIDAGFRMRFERDRPEPDQRGRA